MKEFIQDMHDLPLHVFRADWQHKQMKACIDNLSLDEACLCMDYAESYQCRFQHEVQSAFFEQNQVTLHPMMAYYLKVVGNDTLPVKHAIIGITNDTQKDNCGVKAFEDGAIKIIEREKGTTLTKVNEFTDGCACQYKGKNAFFDVSQRTQPQILRNFFETSHGKSVCDGFGAVVKGSCYQAVVSGKKIICNAEDMMHFCQEKLQVPQKTVSTADGSKFQTIREFLYVERKQVDRKWPEVKTLPGTRARKLHCVRGKGKEFHLDVRALSCYCQGCRQDTRCQNEEFTASWEPRQIQIQRTSTPSTTNTAAPTTTTSTTATEISRPTSVMASTTIMNGDFVAVKNFDRKEIKQCAHLHGRSIRYL